ncbi:hypothetical protein JCM33374_g3510 [Metschnikowia sp. JCM 33374]|nr:hypothetical protein JCM33374_g3510 [Metschnikowia sp. JCM 33374]
MALERSSNGRSLGWWKWGQPESRRSRVDKIRKRFKLTFETAEIVYHAAVMNNISPDSRNDDIPELVASAVGILLIAGKLAAKVHKKMNASRKETEKTLSTTSIAEAYSEEDFLQMIRNLEVKDLLSAAYSASWTIREDSASLPSRHKRVTMHQVQEDLKLAMTLQKDDLGKLLVAHLDENWQPIWRMNWNNVEARASVPASNAIGLALINAVFKLTESSLDAEIISYRVVGSVNFVNPGESRHELCGECFRKIR